jgi:hypothetical protein
MRMILALVVVAALTGCVTLTNPQMEQPGYLKVLAAKKIDAGTYARITHGRVLGYSDIKELARKGVPGKMIVPYLQATKTPYDFSTKQINGLINVGADDVLVNYLGKAKGIYLQDEGNIPHNHPYFTDPYYMGAAPFGFGYPDAWAGDFIGLY